MATVYKARQISLDRIVAVKVLPKRMSENQEFVDRFYKEGRAAARLSHNNIVQAIDVGSTPDGLPLLRDGIHRGPDAVRLMQPPPVGRGQKFTRSRSARYHHPDGRCAGCTPISAA